jgi:periplasmic protein TonB
MRALILLSPPDVGITRRHQIWAQHTLAKTDTNWSLLIGSVWVNSSRGGKPMNTNGKSKPLPLSSDKPRARRYRVSMVLGIAAVAAGVAGFVLLKSAKPICLTCGSGDSQAASFEPIASNHLDVLPAEITLANQSLVDSAMRAYSAGHLVQPAGENALELYLKALEVHPSNVSAREAVLELVPVTMNALESAMSAAAPEEVARLSALLERADPSAARLAALKQRWQTMQVSAAQAPKLVDSVAATAVATEQPVTQAATAPLVAKAEMIKAAEPAAMPQASAFVPPPVRESKPTPEKNPSLPISRIVEARPLTTARVTFPAHARRQKIEGWVDLEVSVDANGRVTETSVVDAQPKKIFDIEARRAVMRWRFTPKIVDDQPVASVLRQRIKFSLNS